MSIRGFLGIDAGTQGLSVIFTDENLEVLGTGEGGYEMVHGLAEGDYEQDPDAVSYTHLTLPTTPYV